MEVGVGQKRKKKRQKEGMTRSKALGGVLAAAATAIVTSTAQKVPDAVITVIEYFTTSTGPAVVGTTAAVSVVATSSVINAAPQGYVPFHPDDQRAGP